MTNSTLNWLVVFKEYGLQFLGISYYSTIQDDIVHFCLTL